MIFLFYIFTFISTFQYHIWWDPKQRLPLFGMSHWMDSRCSVPAYLAGWWLVRRFRPLHCLDHVLRPSASHFFSLVIPGISCSHFPINSSIRLFHFILMLIFCYNIFILRYYSHSQATWLLHFIIFLLPQQEHYTLNFLHYFHHFHHSFTIIFILTQNLPITPHYTI